MARVKLDKPDVDDPIIYSSKALSTAPLRVRVRTSPVNSLQPRIFILVTPGCSLPMSISAM